jgi:hypothetical protein
VGAAVVAEGGLPRAEGAGAVAVGRGGGGGGRGRGASEACFSSTAARSDSARLCMRLLRERVVEGELK